MTKQTKPSTESLIKAFKDYHEEETGEMIDFRKHVFLENRYGGTPTFNYSFAEAVVENLYDWANEYVANHQDLYPDFGGFEYNLFISCEELRSKPLKNLITNTCETLVSRMDVSKGKAIPASNLS